MRRALFVDDEPRILDGLRRMLRGLRGEWDVEFAEGGAAALESLRAHPYDVVVSDMRMPGIDGAALLLRCKREFPATVRIVLSGHMELDNALQSIAVAHQFLTKPCDAATVRSVLTRASRMLDLIADPGLRAMLGDLDRLPLSSRTYGALTTALEDPGVPIERIVTIVEGNPALTAKLLQIANSAFLGLPHSVSHLATAIRVIGSKMLRRLILHFEIVDEPGRGNRAGSFRFEEHDRHAVRVARLASELPAGDPVAREQAYTAGALHDLGELVLALLRPQLQEDLAHRAARAGRPRHELEYEELGYSHAEVGAYLLGLWGLPHAIVEGVAHHHRPASAAGADRDLVVAVHLADALVHSRDAGTPHFERSCAAVASADLVTADVLDAWQARAREFLGTEENTSCPMSMASPR